MPNQQLEAIRQAYDAAVAEAEQDGAAPEGLSTILAARVLYEYELAQQRVLDEAAIPPKAA